MAAPRTPLRAGRWARHAGVILLCSCTAFALHAAWSAVRDRQASARVAGFGPIDTGFARSMAQHHDQAILMAQIMMAKPASRLGRLATALQTKQLIEVGHMQAWLMLARQPLLPKSTEMDWMLLAPVPPDQGLLDYLAACRTAKGMPGMASTDELNQLREAQGETADRLFIELMIRHHHGALPMAAFASKHAETAQVRALALSMRMEQEREMLHLRGLLGSRFASSR